MNKVAKSLLRHIFAISLGMSLASPAFASDYSGMLGFIVFTVLLPILGFWSLFTLFLMLNKSFQKAHVYTKQKKYYKWLCIIALATSALNFDLTSIAMVVSALLIGAVFIVLLPMLQTP